MRATALPQGGSVVSLRQASLAQVLVRARQIPFSCTADTQAGWAPCQQDARNALRFRGRFGTLSYSTPVAKDIGGEPPFTTQRLMTISPLFYEGLFPWLATSGSQARMASKKKEGPVEPRDILQEIVSIEVPCGRCTRMMALQRLYFAVNEIISVGYKCLSCGYEETWPQSPG